MNPNFETTKFSGIVPGCVYQPSISNSSSMTPYGSKNPKYSNSNLNSNKIAAYLNASAPTSFNPNSDMQTYVTQSVLYNMDGSAFVGNKVALKTNIKISQNKIRHFIINAFGFYDKNTNYGSIIAIPEKSVESYAGLHGNTVVPGVYESKVIYGSGYYSMFEGTSITTTISSNFTRAVNFQPENINSPVANLPTNNLKYDAFNYLVIRSNYNNANASESLAYNLTGIAFNIKDEFLGQVNIQNNITENVFNNNTHDILSITTFDIRNPDLYGNVGTLTVIFHDVRVSILNDGSFSSETNVVSAKILDATGDYESLIGDYMEISFNGKYRKITLPVPTHKPIKYIPFMKFIFSSIESALSLDLSKSDVAGGVGTNTSTVNSGQSSAYANGVTAQNLTASAVKLLAVHSLNEDGSINESFKPVSGTLALNYSVGAKLNQSFSTFTQGFLATNTHYLTANWLGKTQSDAINPNHVDIYSCSYTLIGSSNKPRSSAGVQAIGAAEAATVVGAEAAPAAKIEGFAVANPYSPLYGRAEVTRRDGFYEPALLPNAIAQPDMSASEYTEVVYYKPSQEA